MESSAVALTSASVVMPQPSLSSPQTWGQGHAHAGTWSSRGAVTSWGPRQLLLPILCSQVLLF